MYQQDAQHTGRSPHGGPRQAALRRRFDTSLPENLPADAATPRADFQSSSAIGPDGTIYVANFPGVLFALRDSPTRPRSTRSGLAVPPAHASAFHATPALSADGATFISGFAAGGFSGPAKSTLYALEGAVSGTDPQVVWTVDLGDARVMASPTVGPDGTIYVANSTRPVLCDRCRRQRQVDCPNWRNDQVCTGARPGRYGLSRDVRRQDVRASRRRARSSGASTSASILVQRHW